MITTIRKITTFNSRWYPYICMYMYMYVVQRLVAESSVLFIYINKYQPQLQTYFTHEFNIYQGPTHLTDRSEVVQFRQSRNHCVYIFRKSKLFHLSPSPRPQTHFTSAKTHSLDPQVNRRSVHPGANSLIVAHRFVATRDRQVTSC